MSDETERRYFANTLDRNIICPYNTGEGNNWGLVKLDMEIMEKHKEENNSVLADIKEYLHRLHGNNILWIILFGSRSRGDAEKDSDYDILLIVKKYNKELENLTDEVAYEMLDRYGVIVSIFIVDIETFKRETYEPLFCNIRREGIIL